MSVITATTDNFEEEVLQCEKPVLVDFWASWCGPCMSQGPIIDAAAEEYADAKFCKVNVDEQPELTREYKVMSIPTLILFQNGAVQKKMVGLQSKEEILLLFTSEPCT